MEELENLKQQAKALHERIEKNKENAIGLRERGQLARAMSSEAFVESATKDLRLLMARIRASEYGSGIRPLGSTTGGQISPKQSSFLEFDLEKDDPQGGETDEKTNV